MTHLSGSLEFQRLSRRSILQIGTLGWLGLTLPDYLRGTAAAPGKASSAEKPRSAILIFLEGGPSHHETFDPKPDAPAGIRGEFGTVATSTSGVRFSELVPLLAAQMHRVAILRAVTHRDGSHAEGVACMSTGYPSRPGHNFPGIGAVVAHERPEFSRLTGIPPHFGIPSGRGGGHLGPRFNAFSIPGDPNELAFRVPDISVPASLTPERLRRRRQFADQVNENFRKTHVEDVQVAVDRFTAQAYDMMTSTKAQAALDLGREDARTRERYGRTPFGQRVLLARRLVETGVPFVTVNDGDWDHHTALVPGLKKKLPYVDRAVSSLVTDLDERGLLQHTLVILMGEFGRTPRINPQNGRDHWPNAFSVLLAGAGVRGGQVIGASDKEGAYVKDRPVSPEDLFHSIYLRLGIDPSKFLPSTSGRDVPIIRDGKAIKELTN